MPNIEKYGAVRRFPKEWAEYEPNKPMLEVMLEKMSLDLCERVLLELSNGEKVCSLSSVTNDGISTEIEYRQTITITDLVRCKDCKYWDRLEPGHPYGYCYAAKHGYMSSNWDISIYRRQKEDFYCADGERKETEHEV